MIAVGLTGGLGTGKTTVLAYFKKLGASVLSADEVVHQELKKNINLKKKIMKLFGPEVFCKGQINRPILARKAFAERRRLKKLNALIHPLFKKRMFEFLRRHQHKFRKAVVVVEVPLLFEVGFDRFFDITVVVATNPKIQKQRLLQNSMLDRNDIARRMHWQIPLDEKITHCDFVIDNNKTRPETFQQVRKLMNILKEEDSTWRNSK